jgi:hypothetical protein
MEETSPRMSNGGLTTAKEARKRAELDAQLLANRIALLKQEEEKAWKKIEETRKRAGDISTLRNENEQKYIAKEQFYKNKWESIRNAQSHNAHMREQNRSGKAEGAKAHLSAKKAYVHNSKMISREALMEKKGRMANEKAMNEQRTQYIKEQKEEAKARLEAEKQARLLQFQQDYEARVAEEEMLRARTEALVAKMEKEEMELIARLQNTQTVQRSAYEELEAALGSTAASRPTPREGKGKGKGAM